MTNNLILKVKKIQVHGKLTEIQVKDERKVLAQIFPCYNIENEIISYEVLMFGFVLEKGFVNRSLEDALEIIRKKIDNAYNGFGNPEIHNIRIKKNFGAGPVYVSYEGKEI